MKPKRLKRVVIKEELVELTGGHITALILNQFLYWTKRTNDFDKFIKEELSRDETSKMKLRNGWIYKSSEQLKDELMLDLSPKTIRRRIQELVEMDYIDERNNPNFKWDKVLQYRVNINKVQSDLQSLGYFLDGYESLQKQRKDSSTDVITQGQIVPSKSEIVPALPETTTETTTDILATPENFEKQVADGGQTSETLEDYFGPIPPDRNKFSEQQQTDTDKGNILTWGRATDPKLQQAEQYLLDNYWNINDPNVRMAASIFFAVTKLPVPQDDQTRKYWHKTFKKHIQNYDDESLWSLYEKSYNKLSATNMSISSPDSLTKTMYDLNAREQKMPQQAEVIPFGSTDW